MTNTAAEINSGESGRLTRAPWAVSPRNVPADTALTGFLAEFSCGDLFVACVRSDCSYPPWYVGAIVESRCRTVGVWPIRRTRHSLNWGLRCRPN